MPDNAITVTIEKLVQGGRGLAHHGGQVLFVRGAIPAETVSVTGAVQHKGFQETTVTAVLVASPDRVMPPCPVYEVCGGCQLQHIRYEAQLLQKAEILKETLQRIGKVAVERIPAIIASPHPYGYRNAVRFTVFRAKNGFALGFHRQGTHQPVAAAGCLLMPEATRDIVARLCARLAQQRRLPLRLESLEIRRSFAFGSALLAYRTGQATQEQACQVFELFAGIPNVVGQVLTVRSRERADSVRWETRRWVTGQDWIAERLDDLIFRISERSFAQANWPLNERLSQAVTEWAQPSERLPSGELRILELYSGIGTLGLPLARHGALVTEVEANPYALADARHAARANHIGRCRFRALRAEAMLKTVKAGEYDVVIVDPPRSGLSEECLSDLLRIKVARLLYLSCDPPTLARDLSRLCGVGYQIARIRPFDMFPQTAHLETLVELVR